MATHDIEFVVRHRPGASLHTADALSRASLSAAHLHRLDDILQNCNEKQRFIADGDISPPIPI